MRFTKQAILNLQNDPASVGKQFYDDGLSGLSIYIGKKSATFYFQAYLATGKRTRIKIGRFPALTVGQARERGLGIAAEVNAGIDPNQARRRERHSQTLREVADDYLNSRNLKPRTIRDYQDTLAALGSMLGLNFRQIDEEQVISLFCRITKERGQASANKAGRVLRAVLGHAYAVKDKSAYNPVRILTVKRMWHKVPPKTRVIPANKIGAYMLAIDFVRATAGRRVSRNICDYAEFTLMMAFRSGEALDLPWENVDLENGTVFLPDPKNRKPILQPMPQEAWAILSRRQEDSVSKWVFDGRPTDSNPFPSLNNPNRTLFQIAQIAGLEKITSHDLRRTVCSIAESMGISERRLKRMLNHSTSDVTSGYVSPYFDPESLRLSFQTIADYLYKKKSEAHAAGWEPADLTA